MLYFKNDVISIEYDEKHQLAYTKWVGFAGREEYRQALEMILQLVQEKLVLRLITDYKDGKAIRSVDQKWTIVEWMPRLRERGSLLKMAIVESQDIFNRMAMCRIFEEALRMENFETSTFHSLQEAYGWVLQDAKTLRL